MGRFRVSGWRSWVLVIVVWLGLAAGAAALGAEHAGGVWVATAAGIAAALGSVMTAWVISAFSSPEGHPGGGGAPGTPSQLPLSVADFTGRRDLSRQLGTLLVGKGSGSAVVVTAVAGQGGVGKTALAVRVAHELAPRFPGGQLYVNLRGVEREHADPASVLGDFLRDLGVDPGAVPDGLEARSRLYRSRQSGRRALVVLDNAKDEAQVRPLLPGDATCAVIVTSRARLADLEGTVPVLVDVLPASEAIDLLGRIAGPARVAAEPEAACAIIEACGCLPLAVRVVGARLAARQEWRLSDMARRLGGAGRLDELAAGDLSVRASLTLGYTGLDEDARKAFRLLGLIRAADFAAWPIAALLDVPAGLAARLAERLAEAHLVQPQGLDAAGQARYRFHDLVRDFARERLDEEESAAGREAALERFLGACLTLTDLAEPLLQPGGYDRAVNDATRWPPAPDPGLLTPVQADASGWCAAERETMGLAVAQAHEARLYQVAWELADNLCASLEGAVRMDDWAQASELALDAAQRAGSSYGEAVIRRNLGRAEMNRGHLTEARAHYAFAIPVFQDACDLPQVADTLGHLSDVHRDERDYAAARACVERALATVRRRDVPRVHGWGNQMIAAIEQLAGRPAEALPYLDRAEEIFRGTGETRGLGWTLRCRGDARRDLGDTVGAAAAYGSALELLARPMTPTAVPSCTPEAPHCASAGATPAARSASTSERTPCFATGATYAAPEPRSSPSAGYTPPWGTPSRPVTNTRKAWPPTRRSATSTASRTLPPCYAGSLPGRSATIDGYSDAGRVSPPIPIETDEQVPEERNRGGWHD